MLRSAWIIALLVVSTASIGLSQDEPEYMRYPEFLEQVREGAIKRIVVSELSGIEGEFETEGKLLPFKTYHHDAKDDPLLMEFLDSAGVPVEFEEYKPKPSTFSWWDLLFPMLLGGPALYVLLLVLLVMQFRLRRRMKRMEEAIGGSAQPRG